MPRPVLFVVLLAALVGCAADDSHKPDAAWAMSLCKRAVEHDGTTTGPLGFRLLDARVVTRAQAKDLEGGSVPLGGTKPVKYGASCKIRFLHPQLAGVRKGAGTAMLAFEGGFTAFVSDPYWVK